MNHQDVFVNNSAITKNACARAYQLECVWGCVVPANADANFGNAVHRILEYFIKEPDIQTPRRLEIISESGDKYEVRDQVKLTKVGIAGVQALKKLPPVVMVKDRPVVELKFKYHYTDIIYGDTTYHIYLTGTIDYIGFDGNQLVFVDHKTYAGMKASDKLTSYNLHFQLPFYSWIVNKYADTIFGIGHPMAEYARENRMRAHYHLISHNTKEVEFRLSAGVTFPTVYFEEVKQIVDDNIDNMLEVWALGDEPAFKNGMTRDACTFCFFKPACITRDSNREAIFVNRLNRVPYDPMNFR